MRSHCARLALRQLAVHRLGQFAAQAGEGGGGGEGFALALDREARHQPLQLVLNTMENTKVYTPSVTSGVIRLQSMPSCVPW